MSANWGTKRIHMGAIFQNRTHQNRKKKTYPGLWGEGNFMWGGGVRDNGSHGEASAAVHLEVKLT